MTIHTLLVMKIICRMETSWGWEKYLSRPGFPSVKIMESRRKQQHIAIAWYKKLAAQWK